MNNARDANGVPYQRRHYGREHDGYRRTVDRRDDDSYRAGRRDRSRERRRSRSPVKNREPDRDRRYRSRERDNRGKRDDSRDRRNGDRHTERDAPAGKSEVIIQVTLAADSNTNPLTSYPQQSTSNKQAEEEKKKAEDEKKKQAERLAKLEAWKAKHAAAKQKEQKATAADTRSPLPDVDKKTTPATSPPASSAAPNGIVRPEPASYAGKFDPKAIAKKKGASNATVKAALGDDVLVPSKNRLASISKFGTLSVSATDVKGSARDNVSISSIRPLKAKGNLSGFGFGSKAAPDNNASASKQGLDLAEEETTRRKLERLPSPPPGAKDDDAVNTNGIEEDVDDADEDMQDGGTEEEMAAAARAAAEMRENRWDAEDPVEPVDGGGDIQMTNAQETTSSEAVAEEEVDPLDAFMAGLADTSTRPGNLGSQTMSRKRPRQEPEAIFSDAEDVDMVAVGDADDILGLTEKKKKKDIPTTDHSKIAYEPFRKNFFTEPSEIAEMTEEEVAALRLELGDIKVDGKNVPRPITKWGQCGLSFKTMDQIERLGFDEPTPIQCQAIPVIMSGRDVLAVAKTGSGKTMAFLLPMFRHIKDQRPRDKRRNEGPMALILAPTRELVVQIFRECRPFARELDFRVVCAYGGSSIKEQIGELKLGADVVVATPGRMIDLLASNSGRVTNLRRITYVVLDEADRMFDMGFRPQIKKILENTRPDRQTVCFSATFREKLEGLVKEELKDQINIRVGGGLAVPPEITQIVEIIPEEKKPNRLLQILGEEFSRNDDTRILIFVQRQEKAGQIISELFAKGYGCNAIHGGNDQSDREEVIKDFKAGVVQIVIATSVAARGLDVKELALVINYECPDHVEDYIHRVGRTGRAGSKGTAVTFVTDKEENSFIWLKRVLVASNMPVPEELLELAKKIKKKIDNKETRYQRGGFGGKGLERFTKDRDEAKSRERALFRNDDDPDTDEEEEKKDEAVLKITAGPSVQAKDSPTQPAAQLAPGLPSLDGEIIVTKTEAPAASTSNNPLDKVKAAVASIDDRLTKRGQLRPGQPIDNKGPDAGAFHATLEINDFPQKARWAVTNRTNVSKILDATGTSITTKGSHYQQGVEPPEGSEPKLYILVEGDTELAVTEAMMELRRLLREGAIAAAAAEAKAPTTGRYSVV
ncbi:P-loop containing nucleoside triphosphate hydrolase protein [Rhizodiscina lignyota]|uniref:RNA helicase n=1 Tax=Rhizodiscina lignyota TaxID=1504668 RepID=A0A9P4I8H6_9PEZI|nr:P-loop containing nucleoside triphosphate hydrolase protein [Rhizodiscina lignyota]